MPAVLTPVSLAILPPFPREALDLVRSSNEDESWNCSICVGCTGSGSDSGGLKDFSCGVDSSGNLICTGYTRN